MNKLALFNICLWPKDNYSLLSKYYKKLKKINLTINTKCIIKPLKVNIFWLLIIDKQVKFEY